MSKSKSKRLAISTEVAAPSLLEQPDRTKLPGGIARAPAAAGVSAPETAKPASPVSANEAAQEQDVSAHQSSQSSSVANVESSSEESEVEGPDVSDVK